jgi:chromosome segregation ATPase
MARTARPTVMTPSSARSSPAGTATKPGKKPESLPKASPAAAAAPKPSKDELRAQVEALERTVATLKAKAKVTRIAARQADARVAQLEAEVTRLEGALAKASRAAPAKASRAAAVRLRKQPPRERDPGDAVPPGVAVQEPEPLDQEAEAARASLEEKLSGE